MHRTIPILALSLCLTAPAFAADAELSRDDRWRKDVRFLATELPRLAPDTFPPETRSAWDAEVERIVGGIPKWTDGEMKLSLLRLAASLGDPAVRLEWIGDKFFTLTIQGFPDGFRVIRAHQDFDRAVGAKLIAIGDTPLDAAAKLLAPFAGCNDDVCRRTAFARNVTSAEILRNVRLAPADGMGKFDFEDGDGRFSFDIKPRALNETNIGLWTTAVDRSAEKMPLYLRNRDESYWFELLPESKTLYVQYTRSRDNRNKPMKAFVTELLGTAKTKPVDRLVLDLRRNAATDPAFVRPLVDALQSKPALRAPGKLFVVIGPLTYPAGAQNARDLVQRFGATLVGETVPARGRATGEARSLVLPESKLRVTYPVTSKTATGAAPLVPEIKAEMTFDELKAGTDPALAAILARSAKTASAAK